MARRQQLGEVIGFLKVANVDCRLEGDGEGDPDRFARVGPPQPPAPGEGERGLGVFFGPWEVVLGHRAPSYDCPSHCPGFTGES